MAANSISPTHLAALQAVGISEATALAAGVRTVSHAEAREVCGVVTNKDNLDGMAIPYISPRTNQIRSYRLRRDNPERDENGKPRNKYLGSHDRQHLYFGPGAWEYLGDITVPVVFVESEKAVLALTDAATATGRRLLPVGTGGCWNWRGTIGTEGNSNGVRTPITGPLGDFDLIEWKNRSTIIAFDGNAATNPSVKAARRELAAVLTTKGSRARVLDLPVEPGINGPDDYIGRHGPDALVALLDDSKPIKSRKGELEPAVFTRPKVAFTVGDCVLSPLADFRFSGWFNRGAVHMVGGSSGSGKTTLVVDLLRRQRLGDQYLGHVGRRHDFLVIFADRGYVSNQETFTRMGIDATSFPVAHIDSVANAEISAAQIQAAIERQEDIPEAVFVEGADMLVEDPSKPDVARFMGALRRMAEHYGIAVILSVGAGKSKPQEGYALKRDQLFGTIMWARCSDTVLVLTIDGDGTTPRRHLSVLHRNDAAETFDLEFQNGKLVHSPRGAQTAEGDYLGWMKDMERFTKAQFRAEFGRKLSGKQINDLLDGYVKIGTLRAKVKDDRTHYVFRLHSNSTPKTENFSGEDSDGKVLQFSSGVESDGGGETAELLNVSEDSGPDPLKPVISTPNSEIGNQDNVGVENGVNSTVFREDSDDDDKIEF